MIWRRWVSVVSSRRWPNVKLVIDDMISVTFCDCNGASG